MAVVYLRALVSEWEDGEVIFLGAIPVETFEAIVDDDAVEGSDNWGARKQAWIDHGPHGIDEVREIDVRLSVPDDLFEVPQATARGEKLKGDNP